MPTPMIFERHVSRNHAFGSEGGSVVREYWVSGLTEETDVKVLVLATITETYRNLWFSNYDAKYQGNGFWYVTITYSRNARIQDTENIDVSAPVQGEFSFTTAGGTTHLTQSLSTAVQRGRSTSFLPNGKPDPATALSIPKTFSGIGVSREGIAGVDVIAPKLEFTVAQRFTKITMTDIDFFSALTGTVNSADYYGYKPGEVLLEECSGKYVGENDKVNQFDVSFKFAVSKNKDNIEICSGLIVPFKDGWDYLWVGYENVVDPTIDFLIQRPRFASVEQVYEREDFNLLHVGT